MSENPFDKTEVTPDSAETNLSPADIAIMILNDLDVFVKRQKRMIGLLLHAVDTLHIEEEDEQDSDAG